MSGRPRYCLGWHAARAVPGGRYLSVRGLLAARGVHPVGVLAGPAGAAAGPLVYRAADVEAALGVRVGSIPAALAARVVPAPGGAVDAGGPPKYDSRTPTAGSVAQSAEQEILTLLVPGSSPGRPSSPVTHRSPLVPAAPT